MYGELYVQVMFLEVALLLYMRSKKWGKKCWDSGCSCIVGGRVIDAL
jgi:hypothetical protein